MGNIDDWDHQCVPKENENLRNVMREICPCGRSEQKLLFI